MKTSEWNEFAKDRVGAADTDLLERMARITTERKKHIDISMHFAVWVAKKALTERLALDSGNYIFITETHDAVPGLSTGPSIAVRVLNTKTGRWYAEQIWFIDCTADEYANMQLEGWTAPPEDWWMNA